MRPIAPTPAVTKPVWSVGRHIGRRVGLGVTAVVFVAAGVLHFVRPAMYVRIIPPGLPSPATLVLVSGIAEVAGGVGLLVPRLRRPAGWGLVALLVAVFPANIYMAVRADHFTDLLPAWALWLRLPLQAVLIAWVRRVSSTSRKPRPMSCNKFRR